jgi:hypothetical protein
MDLFGIVFRRDCHEISGDIAMQHAQFHVVWLGILIGLAAFASESALAGAITHRAPADPLLDGAPDGPCAMLAEGPAYAPGTDATGHPVVPADVGVAPIAVPDQVMVPLPAGRHGARRARGGGASPYVAIDGRRLAPLVNPPVCGRTAPPH